MAIIKHQSANKPQKGANGDLNLIHKLNGVMENSVETEQPGTLPSNNNMMNTQQNNQLEAEQKINSNVMSIRLTTDGLIIKDETRASEEIEPGAHLLSGVYCQGVQYYDLSGIQYINNTGMAILIDLLKSLLEMGVEVQFVNVHDSIKKKIRAMGLENIINCGEK